MIFTVQKRKFRIHWNHEGGNEYFHNGRTHCIVEEYKPKWANQMYDAAGPKVNWYVMVVGKSQCSLEDQYTKRKGRKVSFTDAMRKATSFKNMKFDTQGAGGCRARKWRTAMWKMYQKYMPGDFK